jgi:putative transposase
LPGWLPGRATFGLTQCSEPGQQGEPQFPFFPFLAKLFADSAYAGSIFHTALGKVLPNLKTEIVRRSDRAKGFVPLPKRWIVQRTLAWLNRCRRLAKDWENLNRSALAFLKLASVRLMLRKLCNP